MSIEGVYLSLISVTFSRHDPVISILGKGCDWCSDDALRCLSSKFQGRIFARRMMQFALSAAQTRMAPRGQTRNGHHPEH